MGVTGDVRFSGYRDDIPRLTQATDALAVTSIAVEAQSRAVPQAFASRTPVVASNVGGVSELVTAGETGWLAPIGDSNAYAESLIEILHNAELTNKVVDRARHMAEAHLSLDGKMETTISIYSAEIDT